MTEPSPQIHMVPIDSITVLNPRARNKRVFNELVTSIAHLGLKKPITVSLRGDGSGYDLVCGQGRLEAFVALGQTKIPAVVIQAAEDDCFVMSLVENLARRQHTPLELIREIGALKDRGYSTTEIAVKTDFSAEYIYAICYLLEHAEKRLLAAVERGIMPHTIAMEIARSQDAEVQEALADAYENKTLPGNQVLAIRRIIEERRRNGKNIQSVGSIRSRKPVTADALVRAYRIETERQKLLVKKATLAQSRLLFVVNALRRLLDDEHFVTLLRAEAMHTMPKPLVERLGGART
ncbi:Chromosome (plasmid) partitioning protein ParB [Paramagnetospirillum magnetotacticum MS-1]|uniref:Chromosome (Plasmid) partitioning protein ParB n=1 Tax=Paramagnetospirillum magnetotacticum MS-1 TaxID=272627 RepID=A0A0C2Z0Z2_PARME|nr:plasmid partitioning protein RepB C-terminal domain-containing protein [Paramagnetospirillum magnetotacticum]KIM00566.1 Chromosome (plasmid) partitioning protein ParB [Paramagnetospirillum magnetotacticum MS-1]